MSSPDLHSLANSFGDFDGSLASTLTLPGSAHAQAGMSTTTLGSIAPAQDAQDSRVRASTSASREPSPPPAAGPSSSQSLSPRTKPTTMKPQDLLSSTNSRHDDDPTIPALDIPLPPEPADLFMAPDGSYLETSSGAAAHDLKKVYDKYLGVGKNVRSPFAITAFINQHGKQMYRVGLRELEAPGALAADAEHRNTSLRAPSANSFQPSHPYPPQTKRRSRMSVHSFLPSAVFKNGTPTTVPPTLPTDGSRSPPVRKLRKTRSIPSAIGTRTDASTSENPPPTPTGRPHAHSVSSADAFRPSLSVSETPTKVSQRDVFADVMCWTNMPISPMGSSSASMSTRSLPQDSGATSNGESSAHNIIIQPFGPGVTFDSPSWRSSTHFAQPILREMQSFESGLTARADPVPRTLQNGGSRIHLPVDGPPIPDSSSAIHVDPSSSASTSAHRRDSTILDETNMHSRYSTEVFDILQNSRGLPALDRISPTSQETTIKLSLKAEESAAPRDDPRFVIWGEVEPDDSEEVSLSMSQSTDPSASSGRSGMARRRSTKGKSISKPEEVLTPPISPKEGPTRMLLAATIERWIAQITSELNYDELIVFLLTYRTYVSALDFGHLLICRFHWALGEPTSQRDEIARRVVRVRTFIAIRQWVVAFFDADFLPNRDLRLLYANWLNTLRRDPVLDRYKDALKIVRQVRKVFRECADRYFRRGTKLASRTSEHRYRVPNFGTSADVPGGNPGADDPDLDLDFENSSSLSDRGSANTSPQSKGSDLLSLRQPLHLAFLQYGRKSSIGPPATGAPHPILMPIPHSPFSRVFVNTIGRLGRWKRVLNQRSSGRTHLDAGLDVSAFDVEASETGDLLLVRGGVEQYLKMVESQMSQVGIIAQAQQLVSIGTTGSAETSRNTSPAGDRAPFNPPGLGVQRKSIDSVPRPSFSSDPRSSTVSNASLSQLELPVSPNSSEAETTPRYSSSSAYTDTLDSPRTPQPPYSAPPVATRQLDIVSIDDLDLDDLSSDENFSRHVGMKKPSRRLPTRRDFEFVRHSTDSVSSMGIRTRDSMLSSTSYMSGTSGASSASVGPEAETENVGGPIQAWQMSALVDSLSDDEEDGDVDAALRRLEGQINEEKQRAKQSKVDRWVRSMQQRQLTGNPPPGPEPLSDSDDEDYGQLSPRRSAEYRPERGSSRASTSRLSNGSSLGSPIPFVPPGLTPDEATTPSAEEAPELPTPEHVPDTHSDTAKPHIEDAVPLEILWSRVDHHATSTTTPAHASTNGASPLIPHPSVTSLPPPGSPTALMYPAHVKRHQSFVLAYRTETLMQHFSMIDRELFLALRFEELVAPSFAAHDPHANFNILDWAQFLRDRARMKAEGRVGAQTGTLTVVRGRFNLVANFVLSEIVLTHPHERMRVYTKFIRLAWKAYELKNYNALVAIIAGLRSSWVSKAIAQCHDRLRAKDERILHDLTSWTSQQGHFMYIRQTVEALTEAKPLEQGQDTSHGDAQSTRSRTASDAKGPVAAPACVPFFGVYLSQLERYAPLPDLIDPTAPHTPVSIDPLTNTFETPSHPEVFSTLSPLPPSIQLEPLISVHKQRLVAGVVRSFVAAQHLASRVAYPLDKKLFQRCLKLRGLDVEVLERALTLYAPQGAGAGPAPNGHGVRASVAR
ncbi:ras GEF [Daedalea quercina L-15889]|uniref:Ras GEF n=1 Tax=Daedalea quercina L-15889 TaxID=1314783 RepID=A0A165PE63_9APHY|nr:ras GEF [Daedalea quercina L-15889]